MDTSRDRSLSDLPDERLAADVLAGARRRWAAAGGLFILVMCGWELAVRSLDVPPHFLPSPSLIGAELVDQFRAGVLARHLLVTALEMVAGFLAAAVLGIALAALVDRSRWLRALVHPYIVIMQATPKVALAPFLVIWFGFGVGSKIANAALVAFFPIFVNTLVGFSSVSVRVLDLLAVLRARPRHVLWKAKVPHALPYIFAGLEIGILMSLIGAVVGEFVSSTAGLGYLIANWNFQLKTAAAFAALTMLVLLGTASYAAVLFVKKRVVFWVGKT